MPLRFLIPLLLVIFSLLVTFTGYVIIRSDLTETIERQSVQYLNLELSQLQFLLEPMLTNENMHAISSLHSFKASELDNKAILITSEKGIVLASVYQQELFTPWQQSRLAIDPALAEKAMDTGQSYTEFSADRKHLNGYIDLCVRDLSKGLRHSSCGFLYYQLDVDYRQEQASAWLKKQSLYFAIGISTTSILFMLILNAKISRRVWRIQHVLSQWSKGNRKIRIELSGRDELTYIALIINRLVTQFVRDEESLIFNQQVNSAILHSADYCMITTDTKGTITTFNSRAEKLLGYDKNELINKKTAVIFHDRQEILAHNKKISLELGTPVAIGFETFIFKALTGVPDENNWTYYHKDGHKIPVKLSVTALYDKNGEIYGYLGIAKDISEQLEADAKLEQLAYYDQLTQLPNRMLYGDRLSQAIAFANRNKTNFSVFFMDLDKFKFVNDNYGHEVGDKLLIEVAKRLTACVRESDTVTRLGGDEFTVILTCIKNQHDPEGIGAIATSIIEALSKDFIINGHLIQIGVSIGIATFPHHGNDASTLNKHADMAMYKAKEHGRGRYFFYDSTEDETI